MEISKYGVHRTHCCKTHGCKYSEEACPVVLGIIEQDYKCQDDDKYFPCFPTSIQRLTSDELLQHFDDAICDRHYNPYGENYNKSNFTLDELKGEILRRIDR